VRVLCLGRDHYTFIHCSAQFVYGIVWNPFFILRSNLINVRHFIVQLMHTNYKILRLLKQLKL